MASDKRTSQDPFNPPVPAERRQRVGAFVRDRRTELGMTQVDLARTLRYRQVASISAIETGKETLATARVYAWADVLEVPRDAFFLFVTGERDEMGPVAATSRTPLSSEELQIIESYRNLPRHHQMQLRDHALALQVFVRSALHKH